MNYEVDETHTMNRNVLQFCLWPLRMALWLTLNLAENIAVWLDHRFGTGFLKPKVTCNEIEQLISVEVRLGTSSREVVGFLKSQNISCRGEVYDNPERNSHFQNPKLAGSRKNIKGYMPAWIPDIGGD